MDKRHDLANKFQAILIQAADHIPNFNPKFQAGDLLQSTIDHRYIVFISYEFQEGSANTTPVATIMPVASSTSLSTTTQQAFTMNHKLFDPVAWGSSVTKQLPVLILHREFKLVAHQGNYALYAGNKKVSG